MHTESTQLSRIFLAVVVPTLILSTVVSGSTLGDSSSAAITAAGAHSAMAALGSPNFLPLDTQIRVSSPGLVLVGTPFLVNWAGPSSEGDFISIDEEGWPESRHGPTIPTDGSPPGELRAPDLPGRYLLRYHSGEADYPVLASTSFEVEDPRFEFFLASPVGPGAELSIVWSGLVNVGDVVSISEIGAEDTELGRHSVIEATAEGEVNASVTMRAPEITGKYQIRYHLQQTHRVVGRADFEVMATRRQSASP